MKKNLAIFLIAFYILSPLQASASLLEMFGASGGGTINQLDQWVGTTTPSSSITQRVYGKPIKITGLSTGSCLSLDGNGVLTTTTCGGGTGSWTRFNSSGIRPETTSDAVLLGASATTSDAFFQIVGLTRGGTAGLSAPFAVYAVGGAGSVKAKSGTAGVGGGFYFAAGTGGLGTLNANGGAGGPVSIISGNGGIGSGEGNGGNAGELQLRTGTGGISGVASIDGGDGGTFTILTGDGSREDGGGSPGNGGNINITAGDGGVGSSVSDGNGGSIYIAPGTGFVNGDVFIGRSSTTPSIGNVYVQNLSGLASMTNGLLSGVSTSSLNLVSSVATNNGLTGGTITTTGTIGLNTTGLSTNALTTWNGSNLVATGTPQLTVGNLVATSSSLTSTFLGTLRAQGPASQTATGFDRLDFGVETGTPRIVFEDAGNTSWLIDQSGANFRWYQPNVNGLILNMASNNATLSVYGANSQNIRMGAGDYSYFNMSGNFGVGTTTPWRKFSVTGTMANTGMTGATGGTNSDVCITAAGDFVNESTGTCIVSSGKFKHDIKSLTVSGLDIVKSLIPKSFKRDGEDITRFGFIAEEAAEAQKELASYGLDGEPRGLDEHSFLSVLWKAVQELADKEDKQEKKIKQLEERILLLEKKLK